MITRSDGTSIARQLDTLILSNQTLFRDRYIVQVWRMIRCAVLAHIILGSYFMEDEEGNTFTVTHERDRGMVIRPFIYNLGRFCYAKLSRANILTSHTRPIPLIKYHIHHMYPYSWQMLKESVFNCKDLPRTIPDSSAGVCSFLCSLIYR